MKQHSAENTSRDNGRGEANDGGKNAHDRNGEVSVHAQSRDLARAAAYAPVPASLGGQLKVIFLENYRVSLAEIIYPAAEISEQISQAGKEASGTGNMKMMLNGALTLGTEDGANVEIHQVVGDDNIFIFGMNEQEVINCRNNGYNPLAVYNNNQYLKDIIEFVRRGGLDGKNFDTIINYLLQNDQYMSLADFDSYRLEQEKVGQAYLDQKHWNQMSLRNISEAGIFSADRAIREYVQNIWYKNVK